MSERCGSPQVLVVNLVLLHSNRVGGRLNRLSTIRQAAESSSEKRARKWPRSPCVQWQIVNTVSAADHDESSLFLCRLFSFFFFLIFFSRVGQPEAQRRRWRRRANDSSSTLNHSQPVSLKREATTEQVNERFVFPTNLIIIL